MASKTQVKNFIEKLGALAVMERNKRIADGRGWVLPSVCIAQAALETGWGTADIMVKANAYFGIKATSSWTGKVYNASTKECYDGNTYTEITDCFRAYDSLEDSVADYFDLICNSKRYAGAVNNSDALSAITAIKQGGYATSPTYIDNVMSIINDYDLRRFDECVMPAPVEPIKSVYELAQEVIAGLWGNGAERKERLTNAGYDYNAIQDIVNVILAADEPAKSIDELAKEVIAGLWGNGAERKQRLTEAGFDYEAVQSRVNELLTPTKTVDELAREVIQGKWGTGQNRKDRLTQAGYDYAAVQARVNELM